jgi:hypothetical protein
VVLAVVAATVAVAEGIRIRAEFAPAQQLHSTWEMEGPSTWTPPIPGTVSGTMRTDFDFDLLAERVRRPRGAVGRELLGPAPRVLRFPSLTRSGRSSS